MRVWGAPAARVFTGTRPGPAEFLRERWWPRPGTARRVPQEHLSPDAPPAVPPPRELLSLGHRTFRGRRWGARGHRINVLSLLSVPKPSFIASSGCRGSEGNADSPASHDHRDVRGPFGQHPDPFRETRASLQVSVQDGPSAWLRRGPGRTRRGLCSKRTEAPSVAGKTWQ